MIRPIDEYVGKVDPVSSQYPDGKARNISAPGDGTGTPLEAKWLNDFFGVMQYLTSKAGITPSGTPENAETSQVFESMWKLLNARILTFNLTADANYTLTADQNLYKNITITDTGVVLTAGRNIIVDDIGRIFLFTNSTAQTLTVKTSGGTGVTVAAGASVALVCDETNVVDFTSFITLDSADTRLNTADERYAGQPAGEEIVNANAGEWIKNQCTAWVNFGGTGTPSINGSFNIASVVKLGTGRYEITFDEVMDNANYSVVGSCLNANTSQDGAVYSDGTGNSFFTNKIVIRTYSKDSTTLRDAEVCNLQVFGGKV